MKIDIFAHILPPEYRKALINRLSPNAYQPHQDAHDRFPALTDLESRFRIMDEHDNLVQVLTLTHPFVETVAERREAVELAKLGNDELAQLVEKYPDRFVGAIANLPMNDLDAALDELDRVIKELHFRGIQLCTDINGKALDAPEFMPIYEKMEQYNLPIFLHPYRPDTTPDYSTERTSKYRIYHIFGWPYDTTAAMTRLVFGRVLQKYPKIKFITHHCGGMIPFFEQRLAMFCRTPVMYEYTRGFDRAPFEYFKTFYADTALFGSTSGLMCGHSFFGADHMLFGTDMPYGEKTGRLVREIVESIERMDITDTEKKEIFEDNAKRVLLLNI